jgi:hypothetical protein
VAGNALTSFRLPHRRRPTRTKIKVNKTKKCKSGQKIKLNKTKHLKPVPYPSRSAPSFIPLNPALTGLYPAYLRQSNTKQHNTTLSAKE